MAQVRLSAPGARVVIVLDAEAEPGPVRAAAVVRGRAITGVQVIPEDPALTNGVIINNPPKKYRLQEQQKSFVLVHSSA